MITDREISAETPHLITTGTITAGQAFVDSKEPRAQKDVRVVEGSDSTTSGIRIRSQRIFIPTAKQDDFDLDVSVLLSDLSMTAFRGRRRMSAAFYAESGYYRFALPRTGR